MNEWFESGCARVNFEPNHIVRFIDVSGGANIISPVDFYYPIAFVREGSCCVQVLNSNLQVQFESETFNDYYGTCDCMSKAIGIYQEWKNTCEKNKFPFEVVLNLTCWDKPCILKTNDKHQSKIFENSEDKQIDFLKINNHLLTYKKCPNDWLYWDDTKMEQWHSDNRSVHFNPIAKTKIVQNLTVLKSTFTIEQQIENFQKLNLLLASHENLYKTQNSVLNQSNRSNISASALHLKNNPQWRNQLIETLEKFKSKVLEMHSK